MRIQQTQNTNFGAIKITLKDAPKVRMQQGMDLNAVLTKMYNTTFDQTTGVDNFQLIHRVARDFKQNVTKGLEHEKLCYTIMSQDDSKTEKSIIEKLNKFFDKGKINLKAEKTTHKVAEGWNEAYRNTLR